MLICSDSLEFAAEILRQEVADLLCPEAGPDVTVGPVAQALLAPGDGFYTGAVSDASWTCMLLTAQSRQSQCDRLLELGRAGCEIPDRTVCLARTGRCFHGFKGRTWSAVPGNIHLAVHFSPHCQIERFEVAFTILAALSVIDALDEVPGLRGRPGIRWVNDIVVGDAKLGGVLACTQTRERVVTSAVLGIGLNVEVTPTVEPTPFVPAVTCVRDLGSSAAHATQRAMLERLLDALQRNYGLLLQAGYGPLLERYRARSTIIGRQCTVCTEESDSEIEVLTTGRVSAIGDGLELRLEGEASPVTRGRLLVAPRPVRGPAADYGASPMPGAAVSRSNDQGSGLQPTARSKPRRYQDADA